ncbi:MAG: hypothetical protein NXH82_13125 [Rhodobacteraceae bacterium]|nr:hypothetical protein [Paracoccaceae bacterium]
MKTTLGTVAFALMLATFDARPALAVGIVERACLLSDRRAASRSLCKCIDTVARQDLTLADRRLMVRFFKNPDLAQRIRQSDRRSHEAFWARYVAYSRRASQVCS